MLQKLFQINAVLLNDSLKNPEKKYIMVTPKILCSTTVSTLLIIRPPNQYIIMISEGSCDTGDWSNDC